MHIDHQLSAYRDDITRQNDAISVGKTAQQSWQSHIIWQRHKRCIQHAEHLPPLSAVRHLQALLDDMRIAEQFVAHFIAAMRRDALINLQTPYMMSQNSVSMVLLQKSAITVSLVMVRNAKNEETQRISLSSGAAALRLVNTAKAAFSLYQLHKSGNIIKKDQGLFNAERALIIDNATQGLAINVEGTPALFLRVTANAPNASSCQRYFDRASGKLLAKAAGDKRSTQRLMLLSALRNLGADRHIQTMLKATYEGIPALRWQAMREYLATDMHASLPRLTDMARSDDDDELRQLANLVLTKCQSTAL